MIAFLPVAALAGLSVEGMVVELVVVYGDLRYLQIENHQSNVSRAASESQHT